MKSAANRRGATLTDLVVTLAIVSIVSSMAAPRLGAARDGWAAANARNAAVAIVGKARTQAIAQGSARLVVDPVTAVIRLESPIGVRAGDALHLRDEWGVTLVVDRASSAIAIDFDGLGLGRIASRTLRFQRGGAEARLSLSTYGRPRRW